MKRTFIVAGIALVATVGCGKSEEQKAAEQVAKGAEQMAKGAQQMAQSAQQGAQQMAQGMQQMGVATNAKVVEFEKLQALLPEVSGWTRGDVSGNQGGAMGFNISRAEARYTAGESRINLEITDAALAQMMLAPFSIWMTTGFNERSSDGYRKSATVSGQPGFEEWKTSSKHGEVTAVVASRFIVAARGDDVDSIAQVRKVVESVDFGKLAALK